MTLIVDIYHGYQSGDQEVAQSYAFPDSVTSDEIARWIYNAEPERVQRLTGDDPFKQVLETVRLARGSDGKGNAMEAAIAYWLTINIRTP
ncbi:hypothetical protein PP568_13210 [Mycobacteroides abscessus]|jgi:hypothetical protein|uniref:Uncharacterized protein n=1 Tax=Mycobacteroides abscessus subsp. abscessus TaxID=1185650 RepID=A0AB38D4A2_9MYCO|nr:hypothetical protein [Mycobacteroides abscessus]QSM03246.1 hypothetical protein PROPHIGD102-2_44 [Mycobacterium phage prophi102-2]QSM04018.1 hypothetical protein PROPHIGD54-1_44 [Mycobacterium phage prophiGD54-1]MBE5420157.1 hypothetical protein [Mycobacteroides abscessus]MBE5455144.1 hypothetical protein [Mycobacteroides abscessus]MBN7326581.1 hypothetical protein [Mycobacteroides abscessus subsp. abscessus]